MTTITFKCGNAGGEVIAQREVLIAADGSLVD